MCSFLLIEMLLSAEPVSACGQCPCAVLVGCSVCAVIVHGFPLCVYQMASFWFHAFVSMIDTATCSISQGPRHDHQISVISYQTSNITPSTNKCQPYTRPNSACFVHRQRRQRGTSQGGPPLLKVSTLAWSPAPLQLVLAKGSLPSIAPLAAANRSCRPT